MDKQYFYQAAFEVAAQQQRERNGIGTLGEKTLHAVLKLYIEPRQENHEIKVGRYVADIMNEEGITEVQTRNFNAFRKKLACFLVNYKVTVVYPIAQIKWLTWIDTETGQATAKRKSPKTGRPYDIFAELYRIKQLLQHPNLSFRICMLEMQELRYLNGWSKDKKKGSSRCDRIPSDIISEVIIRSKDDYQKLIPGELPQRFTAKDYRKCSGLTIGAAQTALNVLFAVGAVDRTDKIVNAFVYERNLSGRGDIGSTNQNNETKI
jgi:hypothetical protein